MCPMAGLLRKLAQNRDQMTRSDFRSAAAEPEGADGHFVLACEQRALRQGSQASSTVPPSSLPAATSEAPQHLLPSLRAVPASLPRAAVELRLRPAVPPAGTPRGGVPCSLGSSRLEQVRGSPLKARWQQANKGKRQERRAMPSNGRPGPAGAAALPSIGARRSASAAAPFSRPPPGRAQAPPIQPTRSIAAAAAHFSGHGGPAAGRASVCAGSLPACPGRRARRGEAAKR